MSTILAEVGRPQSGYQARRLVHPATLLLAASMFTTGFSGLVNEYVLATTATYIMGDSIFQWSLIIAVMMAMMGIGAWAQRLIGDRRLIEKFALVEMALALTGGFAPLCNYWVFANQPELYSFTSLGLAALIGLFVGFEIPLVMRINEAYVGSLKSNAAWIFGLDYVGSFVGALVWIFWLLPNYPLTELSFIVSGLNFSVATVTLLYFWSVRAVSSPILGGMLLSATAVALVVGYSNNRTWNTALEQKFYEDRVILSTTSRYQHIVLTQGPRTKGYELFLNGKKQFSSLDEHIYHDMLVHVPLGLAERRDRVLILGGGDGLALREVLKYPDVQSVTLVDLDPAMTELAKTNPVLSSLNEGAFTNARVRVLTDEGVGSEKFISRPIFMSTGEFDSRGRPVVEEVATVDVVNIDASIFLDKVSDTFDVIIIDFPDPESEALAKLYSEQMFRRIRERLSPHGLLSIQATSPYHAQDAYLTIGATLRAAGLGTIPYHQNVPSFGEWGWWLGFAGSERREELVRERIQALEEIPVPTTYIDPDVLRASLVFSKKWLESPRAGVSTLTDPILLDLYLKYAWRVE